MGKFFCRLGSKQSQEWLGSNMDGSISFGERRSSCSRQVARHVAAFTVENTTVCKSWVDKITSKP